MVFWLSSSRSESSPSQETGLAAFCQFSIATPITHTRSDFLGAARGGAGRGGAGGNGWYEAVRAEDETPSVW